MKTENKDSPIKRIETIDRMLHKLCGIEYGKTHNRTSEIYQTVVDVIQYLEDQLLPNSTPEISEEEIKKKAVKYADSILGYGKGHSYDRDSFKQGAKWALSKGAKPIDEKTISVIQGVLSEYIGPHTNDRVIAKIKAALKELNKTVCNWTNNGEYYDTSCDEAYCLIDGTLSENKHLYCPYCGGRIKELNQ